MSVIISIQAARNPIFFEYNNRQRFYIEFRNNTLLSTLNNFFFKFMYNRAFHVLKFFFGDTGKYNITLKKVFLFIIANLIDIIILFFLIFVMPIITVLFLKRSNMRGNWIYSIWDNYLFEINIILADPFFYNSWEFYYKELIKITK